MDDGSCLACPPGTYTTSPNLNESCHGHRTCSSGTFLATPGTATADAACSSCPSDTYQDQNEHSFSACKAKSVCTPGLYAATNGDDKSDRTCSSCQAGTYTPTNNTQSQCLVCPAGSAGVGAQASSCTVRFATRLSRFLCATVFKDGLRVTVVFVPFRHVRMDCTKIKWAQARASSVATALSHCSVETADRHLLGRAPNHAPNVQQGSLLKVASAVGSRAAVR